MISKTCGVPVRMSILPAKTRGITKSPKGGIQPKSTRIFKIGENGHKNRGKIKRHRVFRCQVVMHQCHVEQALIWMQTEATRSRKYNKSGYLILRTIKIPLLKSFQKKEGIIRSYYDW